MGKSCQRQVDHAVLQRAFNPDLSNLLNVREPNVATEHLRRFGDLIAEPQ